MLQRRLCQPQAFSELPHVATVRDSDAPVRTNSKIFCHAAESFSEEWIKDNNYENKNSPKRIDHG